MRTRKKLRIWTLFTLCNLKEIKLITHLSLGLSHISKLKFKHSSQNSLNLFCIYSSGKNESNLHYLLHCSILVSQRMTLLNSIRPINHNTLEQNHYVITRTFLYGDASFRVEINTLVLNSSITHLISTKRFNEPLLITLNNNTLT